MKKSLLLLLMSLSFTLTCRAQTFSNLDFEYWQAKQFPLFWQHPGMSVSADSVMKSSGHYSLKAIRTQAEVDAAQITYGLLMQDARTAFEIAAFQGKTIKVSAQIKSKSADTTAHVCVFVQIADPKNSEINKISFGNNVAGSKDWAASTIELAINKATPNSMIYMGVIMMGKGEMWVDDYQIKCDEQSPNEALPRKANLIEQEKKWLAQNIIPIVNEKLGNAKQFSRKTTSARLVGVGDNVHGSATVFKLKNIVSQNLIQNDGFTLLAIEDSPCVGQALTQYVLGLTDTIENEMNIMYSNDEFKGFLSWLRQYNKSAAKKVRIFGADVNVRYKNQIKYLDHHTTNKFSVQLDSIRSFFDIAMKNYGQEGTYNDKIPLTAAQKQYCITSLGQIADRIKILDLDNAQKTLLNYYNNNLLNYLTFDRYEREKQMAQNVNWLLDQHPSEKMIYMAHNSHVGNMKNATGTWLKEWLDDKYYIIGCCYFDGTELYKQYAVGNSQSVINKAVKGSVEYLLNQIKSDCFYLDLSKSTKNTSNEWLFQPLLMRNYGVEPFNYYHEFGLTQMSHMYDGIVFTKHSVSL